MDLLNNGPGDPDFTEDCCPEYLMEPDWVEGFQCTLPPGHPGLHMCRTWTQCNNSGVDKVGRRYHWTHVWQYEGEK